MSILTSRYSIVPIAMNDVLFDSGVAGISMITTLSIVPCRQ